MPTTRERIDAQVKAQARAAATRQPVVVEYERPKVVVSRAAQLRLQFDACDVVIDAAVSGDSAAFVLLGVATQREAFAVHRAAWDEYAALDGKLSRRDKLNALQSLRAGHR